MSTHQDVADTTLTVVAFDTDGTDPSSFDLGTKFDDSTYKYTIPNTGYYYLAAATRWAGSGGSSAHSVDDDLYLKRTVSSTETTLSSTTALAKDTVTPHAGYIQAYPTYQIEGIFHLNKDDTVHVAVYAEAGAFRITGGTQAYFQGFQIA